MNGSDEEVRGGKGRRDAFGLEEDGGDEKGLEEIGYWHFKTPGLGTGAGDQERRQTRAWDGPGKVRGDVSVW